MNKILIVYASKSGTTEKCAYRLAKELKLVDVVNLSSNNNIDLSNYQTIIIGGYIRMGLLSKKVKRFIKENEDILKNKNVAYFICCGFIENKEKYFKNNINSYMLDNSIIYDSFGGELNIKKCSMFDKMIVKKISDNKDIKLFQDSINFFVNKVNDTIKK